MITNRAQTPEDRQLLNRGYDVLELSERHGKPEFLGFLNEHESSLLKDNISSKNDISFFGGYENAQRVMMGVNASPRDFPIAALEFTYRKEFELRHKDFLGSLMGLGINRDTVGDILTEPGRAVIFVRGDIEPFVTSQLTKIGRVGVGISPADLSDLPLAEEAQERVYSISSLRLDVFVSALTGLSREKALRLIRSDLVMVDHVVENNPSKTLFEGNTITIRKFGKFVFCESLGVSKKGKLRVSVKHFR